MAETEKPRRLDRTLTSRLVALLGLLVFLVSTGTSRPSLAATSWALELFASGLGGLIHRHAAYGFDAGLLVQVSSFKIALLAPMRFEHRGLRHRDWDERTDFGRIVGELSWGEPKDPIHVRIAAISSLTVGVGNLVFRYASTVDVDHWRTGLVAAIDFKPAGGVVFVDSVLDPQVAGGRIHVRPFFWADDRGTFGRMEIGLSMVGDAAQPSDVLPGAPDAHGLPSSRTTALLAGGIDLRWPVYRNRVAEVTPYAAWSRLGKADGVHVGLALDFAPHRDVRLAFQGEWRWLGSGYVASYFDGLYMADRYDFNGVSKAVARRRANSSRMGGMAGALLAFEPYVSLGAVVEWDARSEFRKVRGDLIVTVPERMRLAASIGARGFVTGSDLGHPVRRVAAASVDVSIYRSIAVFAAYSRDLVVVPAGQSSSRYTTSDSVLAGLRLGLAFGSGDGKKSGNSAGDSGTPQGAKVEH